MTRVKMAMWSDRWNYLVRERPSVWSHIEHRGEPNQEIHNPHCCIKRGEYDSFVSSSAHYPVLSSSPMSTGIITPIAGDKTGDWLDDLTDRASYPPIKATPAALTLALIY
jgi:hypothetical protein